MYSYDLKDLNASPSVFCESGTHDFQAIAVGAAGQILLPHEVQSSLELPSLRLRKSVTIEPFGLNRERQPPIIVEALNTFAKVLLKTAAPTATTTPAATARVFLADDQCVCELDQSSGAVLRKFDFYTMVSISDFCPEPERDCLLVTDASRHNLLIFNCKQQQMFTVGGEGATPGSFSHPAGVAVDAFGHIFVADAGNSRVQCFDLQGRFLKLLPYPQSLKDITAAAATPVSAYVLLQPVQDYLYLWDSRAQAIYRIKYL